MICTLLIVLYRAFATGISGLFKALWVISASGTPPLTTIPCHLRRPYLCFASHDRRSAVFLLSFLKMFSGVTYAQVENWTIPLVQKALDNSRAAVRKSRVPLDAQSRFSGRNQMSDGILREGQLHLQVAMPASLSERC